MITIETDARNDAHGHCPSGYIVAAVHPGSRHFDSVVNSARELADVTGRQVVFLTVVTRRPLSTELTRTRIRLARHPLTIHLVGAWIDGEDLSATERSERVAAELVRGARELAAGTMIVGLDPTLDVSATSVPAHVAKLLPRDIDLRFSGDALDAMPRSPAASGLVCPTFGFAARA